MPKTFALSALLAVFAQQAAADKCYALALSSGDQDAMYQAGVIKGLADNVDLGGAVGYTAISGVAGGAVNAAILANYAVGQESDAAERMKTFWTNSANTKLYKNWLGGIAEGLLIKGGLYNDEAMLGFLKTELADITPSQRWIDVGLTDVLKGSYVDFKPEDLTGDDFYNTMYAQFAQAGVFPPVEFNDTDYFDGSTIWDLDIFSVVNKCKDMGFADTDIIVDTILTSEKTLSKVDASEYKSLQMLWRYLQVNRYYSNMDGFLRAKFAYPQVTFRHKVAPSEKMPSSFYPLNLKQDDTDKIWDLGVKDGEAAAKEPPTDNLFHYYALKKKGDARLMGGVSYDEFLALKEAGEFMDFDLMGDKQVSRMFLQ